MQSLPQHLVAKASDFPERGMDYTVVDFVLKRGEVIRQVTVIHGEYYIHPSIDPDDVVDVRLST